MPKTPAWIHVELAPMWSHIKNLRHFVREFCLGMDLDGERADQIAMATSELLENATKYASTRWVRYDLRVEDGSAEMCVTNRATPEQQAVLLGFVDQVGQGEALEVYLQCLERQSSEGVSQSGLARIRYEASGEISAVAAGDEITVMVRIAV